MFTAYILKHPIENNKRLLAIVKLIGKFLPIFLVCLGILWGVLFAIHVFFVSIASYLDFFYFVVTISVPVCLGTLFTIYFFVQKTIKKIGVIKLSDKVIEVLTDTKRSYFFDVDSKLGVYYDGYKGESRKNLTHSNGKSNQITYYNPETDEEISYNVLIETYNQKKDLTNVLEKLYKKGIKVYEENNGVKSHLLS